ncbi:MAG: endonuclease [Bacteroidetes bacterium]|nr:endonuclease [Bacteroidota bacterium]
MRHIVFTAFILFSLIVSASAVYSGPGTYYNSISTSSPSFVTDLESRIRSPYTRITYDNYAATNIVNFASIDNGNGTRSVFCFYSGYEYIYSGTFTWGTMSREHVWAFSWMGSNPSTSNDQYSDQHHLFPTHQNNANNRRSNHPYGIVVNVTYQFLGGKVGTNSLGQIVYEPMNSSKGDAARAMLYMAVRYDGLSGYSWNFNWLNGTRLPSLSEAPQDLNVLFAWNAQDPPDKWEVDRNDYVQSIQQNRNPFTDHPEYISYINFNDLSKLNPVYANEPTNYPSSFNSVPSNNSVNLSWTDATGAQLPSGYLIVAYDRDNYFIPVDGYSYANDTVLTDGAAVVNIPYSSPDNYTFQNLIQNNTYYFTVYSYNGSGSQINYKTNGTVPQTNSLINNSLATEPTYQATNFSADTVTESSVQLKWNDALPGTQTPSGYLLVGNTTNVFSLPADGTEFSNDSVLSDGNAAVNINYSAADNYTFKNLLSNTSYYFRIYSYNGTGTSRNYKTTGVPETGATTLQSYQNFTSLLLDDFNRSNSNYLGITSLPFSAQWQETETVSPTSIVLSSGRNKSASTTVGREFAYVDMSGVQGYPSQYSGSNNILEWAINLRQSRTDPSGFDNNNYGTAFILGKSSSDLTTGNGYAVVLGQSGSIDAIRLAKFSNGINLNSKFTNVISSGDYANQYLSIRVTFNPTGKIWSLYADDAAGGFVQSDPRNTSSLLGSAADSTYTSMNLNYVGTLWNHATGANDSCIFDDVYIPYSSSATLDLSVLTEGLYDVSNNRLNKNDTVKVYLRNSASPFAVADSSENTVDSLTYACTFHFPNISSGSYYIEVKHRNSVETWSKYPQFLSSGNILNYDFSTSAVKAFGDNLILKGGKYCLFSGDVNQDGTIDLTDLSLIDNDAFNFISGYTVTDINGDDIVDLTDASITDNNAYNFIGKITP